eukprot:8601188-Pyramimonas_sp.AAC.1
MDITFIADYLNDGVGAHDTNGCILAELTGYLRTNAKYVASMRDWTMIPEDLWQTGWVTFARGTIVKSPGVIATTSGNGRILN